MSEIPEILSSLATSNFDKRQLEEELTCPVCTRMVIRPTTLTCGHIACRGCLARWYFTSKKKECPHCRLPYVGQPKINTQIRNMTLALWPEEVREREKEEGEDEELLNTLRAFEAALASENAQRSKKITPENVSSFFYGLMLAASVFLVLYLSWFYGSNEENLLVSKPVPSWKPKDVASWLSEFEWAADYVDHVTEHHIDGALLLSFSESDLKKYLNITEESHLRALQIAKQSLEQTGLKAPVTIWEYKAIYPGRAMFALLGMKAYPRLTLLYMYLYFYEDMFLPFLKATTWSVDLEEFSDIEEAIIPTTGQWTFFLVCALLLPQALAAIFTVQMFQHHFYTPISVLLLIIVSTAETIAAIADQYSNPYRLDWVPQWLKKNFLNLIYAFGVMLFWPVIPTFLCNMVFYFNLFFAHLPEFLNLCYKFAHRLFRQQHVHNN